MIHLLLPLLVLAGLLIVAGGAQAAGQASFRLAMLEAEDSRASTPAALQPLFDGLASADPELQRLAVRALGRLERPELARRIEPLLAADTAAVRAEAANALGQALVYADDRAVASAARAIGRRLDREQDAAVQAALCRTLGRLPYRQAREIRAADSMLREAASPRHARRVEPARSGSPIGTPIAGVAIGMQRPTEHPPLEVLLGAVKGLESLIRLHGKTSPASRETIDRLRELAATTPAAPSTRPTAATGATSGEDEARVRRLALAALNVAGAADRATIDTALRDPDAQVRQLAAVLTGAAESLADRAALLDRALRDRSPIVRYEALRAHGRRLPTEDCGSLIEAMSDPDVHVALLATDLLGDGCPDGGARQAAEMLARGARGLPAAAAATAAFDPHVHWHGAAHALVAIARLVPMEARDLLPRFTTHAVWQVRMYAARAAAALGEIATLEDLARDGHDNVREAALAGLRTLRGHDVDALYREALASDDYQLVRTAALALEGSPNRRDAVPALFSALARLTMQKRDTSRDPRAAILERIAELGSPEQAPQIRPYLEDFDALIAARSAEILTRWTGEAHTARPRPLPTPPLPDERELARLSSATARVTMTGGSSFDLDLLASEAPVTVGRFVRLARAGYYDGLTFHRVVPNFVVQGGSPGGNEYMGDGPYLRDELGLVSHVRGTAGISTRGRDTGDAQMFINLVDNPRLDHNYTVFARVVRGLEVVDGILEGDRIEKIEIIW